MHKFTADVRYKKNRGWRFIYNDCTFNMAMYELEQAGFVCADCRRSVFDEDVVYITGSNADGKVLRYVWLESEKALFMEE